MRPFSYSCGRNFGTISGTPSLDLENSNEGYFRVQHPKVDLETRFEGNLDPSLNPSLLHGRCHERLFWYCGGGAVLPSILVGLCSV